MAKFEMVPLAELKTRLPAKLLPLVEEFKQRLEKLNADQGGRLVLEKGHDPKDLRKALKAAASAVNRRIRFPFRGEERAVSFYREKPRGGGPREKIKPPDDVEADRERPRHERGRERPLGATPGSSTMPTNGIGLKRLQHLVLWVSDVERSVRFYRDVLGFEVKMRYPNAAFLRIPGSADDHHLGLFEQRGAPPPDEGVARKYHSAWEVGEITDLRRRSGREPRGRPRGPGSRAAADHREPREVGHDGAHAGGFERVRRAGLLHRQHHDQHRALALELEQAKYQAALAARRYGAVDPDNRLVAAELEARWNVALERVNSKAD